MDKDNFILYNLSLIYAYSNSKSNNTKKYRNQKFFVGCLVAYNRPRSNMDRYVELKCDKNSFVAPSQSLSKTGVKITKFLFE